MFFKQPQKYLGPSQVATVLGANKFQTKEELKVQLEQGYMKERTEFIVHGISNEPIALRRYISLSGNKVTKANFVVDRQCPRFGGVCDGLIDDDGGVEIKCKLSGVAIVYDTYVIQAIAYMYLYDRQWFDILVDVNDTGLYQLQRVYWKDYGDTWYNDWYPRVLEFIKSVHWAR